MSKLNVLFVCIHNSARSQMAEELLRKMDKDRFDVESAGLEPGQLNPIVVEVLKEEEGIDITGKKTQAVADMLNNGKKYDYVIAVCDGASAEKCPLFTGVEKNIHWNFTDPSQFSGFEDDKKAQTIVVKEEIKAKLLGWVKTL